MSTEPQPEPAGTGVPDDSSGALRATRDMPEPDSLGG